MHLFLGSLFALNIVFNYAACALTDPGSPPRCANPGEILGDRKTVVQGQEYHEIRREVQLSLGVSYKFCKTCRCVKPPRAHHDTITGKCVYEMDHYCPWMNNVVGYNNYVYFILFLGHLLIGCTYYMFMTSERMFTLANAEKHQVIFSDWSANHGIMFTFTIALSGAISVAILLSWHIFLLLTNQTTIEFYINIENRSIAKDRGIFYKNPFDEGVRKNLRRVFGDNPWYRFLVPGLYSPVEPKYPLTIEPGQLQHMQEQGTSSV
jgi:palmitoyltransferase